MIYLILLKDLIIALAGALGYKGVDVTVERHKRKKREAQLAQGAANLQEESLIDQDNIIESHEIPTTPFYNSNNTAQLSQLQISSSQNSQLQLSSSQNSPQFTPQISPELSPQISSQISSQDPSITSSTSNSTSSSSNRPPALYITPNYRNDLYSPLSVKSSTKPSSISSSISSSNTTSTSLSSIKLKNIL